MKNQVVVVSLLACAFLGCHKEQPKAPVPATNPSDFNVAAPTTFTSPVEKTKPSSAILTRTENDVRRDVVGDEDPFLTQQLRIFMQQKQRLPESFAEFASARLDSIPRPPSGKKWVIDSAGIQVKAVSSK